MQKCLFDADDQHQVWGLSFHRKPILKLCITYDFSFTANTERVAMTRNNENQTDLWIDQQIFERIKPVISEPVRNRERFLIQNRNEPRGISLGRKVQSVVLAP